MDFNTSGFSVLHHLLELAQTHVHWVSDAIQSSHPLPSPSPPAFNPSHLLTFAIFFFHPGSASSGQTISNYINCCSSWNNYCSHEIKRYLLLGRKIMTNLDSILKSRDIPLPAKVCLVKATVFPVVIYGCESSTIKKAECWRIDAFWTVVLEKTLESPLDCKEIQSVHPKGNQFWVFIGRTDVEAETPILWPPDVKSWLIWKDPDAGKDWGHEEKRTKEDEMVGWHHQLKGHEFE